MERQTRKLGIDILGAVPWGTHICLLYDTKQDLIDVLVPYFQTGLENNESCICITSETLAEKALRNGVPDFPQYLASRQIEIIPAKEWYLKDGIFNGKRVLNAWIHKLQGATSRGYDGLRIGGDTAWLESADWNKFTDYEEEINNTLDKYQILALCAYPLHKYGASKIMDVECHHQYSITMHEGKLVIVGGSEYMQAEESLRLQSEIEANMTEGVFLVGLDDTVIRYANPKFEEMFGYEPGEMAGKHVSIVIAPTEKSPEETAKEIMEIIYKTGEWHGEVKNVKKDGTPFWCYANVSMFNHSEYGRVLVAVHTDITKLKQEEEKRKILFKTTSGKPITPLQKRFLREGFSDLGESAGVRLIFNLCRYRPECDKDIKKCIKQFKNARVLMSASDQELQQAGVCSRGLFVIKLFRELPTEMLKQKIMERSIYKSSREVFDYLYYSMRDLKNELFKVLYLNNRSQIIDVVDLFEGTKDSIHIRPREIVESSIRHGAAGLIFVHNHPTGDPSPSKTDKQLTRDLVFVGMILQINVLDHIIIGENSYFSFADDGLIQKYQDVFFNLKIRGVLTSNPIYQHYNHLPRGLHFQRRVNNLSNIINHLKRK